MVRYTSEHHRASATAMLVPCTSTERGVDMKRSVRLLALMLVVALFAAGLAGCGKKDDTTGDTGGEPGATTVDTFTYAQGADPRGPDPALDDDRQSSKVIVT